MSKPPLTTEAVVLRGVPYRDADLVVTLYTRERGKVSALARAARKSQRRFGGGLALFNVGVAELREGRSELWTLASFRIERDFSGIARDLAATAHGSYGAELVRELTVAEQADADVLELLVQLYAELAGQGAAPSVLRAFELRLLDTIGLAPVLDRCVGCNADGARLDEPGTVLDGPRGGVMCPACAHPGGGVRPLSADARQLLAAAQGVPTLGAARELAGVPGATDARDAMLGVLLAHVGKPLKSVEFIAKMTGATRRR